MAGKKIKKILVALDGSKNSLRALTKAITLAKLMNAQITGIFVIQAYPTEIGIVQTIVGNALSKKCKNFMSWL
jgi:nucleotide-binding universal stress UspA family protein